MRAITAKVRPAQFVRRLDAILERSSQRVIRRFEDTTVNFERVHPDFILDEYRKGADLIVIIAPADNKDGKIWGWYLDKGTSVRYAILSSDWASKTSPGTLRTTAGSGRVLYIDIDNPQPGIEARGWTEIVRKIEQGRLETSVNKLMDKNKIFSGI